MLRVWPGARGWHRADEGLYQCAWITRSPTARASRRRSIPQREVRFTDMRSMRLSLLRLLSMTGVWSPRFHCCPATSRRLSRRPFIPRLCGSQRMSPRGKQSIMVSTAWCDRGSGPRYFAIGGGWWPGAHVRSMPFWHERYGEDPCGFDLYRQRI